MRFTRPAFNRCRCRVLREIVPQTTDMIVSLGLPLFHRGGLFNTACLLAERTNPGFRRQAEPGRRGTPLRAAMVQALARQRRRRRRTVDGRVLSARRSGLRLWRRSSRLRDLRRRLGREPAGRRTGRAGRRHDPQPQRQPLRVSASTRFGDGSCWTDRGPFTSATSTPTCWATKRAERSTTATR